MDAKQLREQDIPALNEELIKLLKEHFELRMQNSSAQLKDNSKLRKIKRSVARVKTIIQEKQS